MALRRTAFFIARKPVSLPETIPMSPKEFQILIAQKRGMLATNRQADVLRIATDLKGLVAFRVQSSGQDFRGMQFKPYSKRRVQERKLRGLQVQHVDYTDYGRLWNAVRPYVIENTPTQTVVSITALPQSEQDKLQSAVRQGRGNILIPSKTELDLAEKANQARIDNYLIF